MYTVTNYFGEVMRNNVRSMRASRLYATRLNMLRRRKGLPLLALYAWNEDKTKYTIVAG